MVILTILIPHYLTHCFGENIRYFRTVTTDYQERFSRRMKSLTQLIDFSESFRLILPLDNIAQKQRECLCYISISIHKCKLNYRLDELPDRIGNIVCKFDIETLRTTPKRLGEHGMTYSFELAPEITHGMNLRLHIEQEHDMQLFHHTCEKNGIVHDNRKIFEYLSTFETKCDNVQLSLFDKDFAGKSPNGI